MKKYDVEVILLRGISLKDARITGTLEPYLQVKCQSNTTRSSTKKGSNPEWNEVLKDQLVGIHEDSLLTFTVYDERSLFFRDRAVGSGTAKLSELKGNGDKEHTIMLVKTKNKKSPETNKTEQVEEGRGCLKMKIITREHVSDQPQHPIKGGFKMDVKQQGKGLWIFGETEPMEAKYDLGRVLGEGAFGVIRKAVRKPGGKGGPPAATEVAVKSISKAKLTSMEAIEDVRREIEVMHHLMGHPNVVQLEEVLEDEKAVHIVMEICKGGNLYQYILNRGEYRESDVAQLMKTIMEVVAHCHAMNVLHRDLKPENFLLADRYTPGQPISLKATDFGLSAFQHKPCQTFAEVVGTCYYIAPEVLRRRGGQPADIWSAGVVMYVLLCGRPPFSGNTEDQVFRNVLEGELNLRERPWNIVSAPCKDLLRKMLERDPSRRPTAREVLAHPWFRTQAPGACQPAFEPEVLRRLKNFAAANMLKKATMLWMSHNTEEGGVERAGLDAMFDDIDSDNDHRISVQEFAEALRRRGTQIPQENLEGLLKGVDMDKDGNVTREEFVAAGMHLMRTRTKRLQEAFAHFDQNGDNFISLGELQEALKEYGPDDMSGLMAVADTNNDGVISFDEFRALLRA